MAGVDKIAKSLQTMGYDSHNRVFVVLMTSEEFEKEFPTYSDGRLHDKLVAAQLQDQVLQVDQSEVYKSDSQNQFLRRGFWIIDGAHRSVSTVALLRPCP